MTHQSLNPNFRSKVLALIFAALIFSPPAFSQQLQDAVNQQDWIMRQQQNQIEEQRRNREQDAIKKDRERRKKEEQEKTEKEIPAKSEKCFPINEIKLLDAHLISKRQQKKLTKPFLGKCFDAKTLSELVAKIQNYYNEKGYVTTVVGIPKQNIQDGILELKITEGKVEEIIINDNHTSDKMQEFTAFGPEEGNPLNIYDINQGIYQINRLPSNNATIKIEPGISEGESKVLVVNQKKFPARATAGYDNLGNNFTGVRRDNFSSGFDNLFSLNDSLNLSYSTNTRNYNDSQKYIKSFSGSTSIPFGYNTFSYDYSHSEFKGTQSGISGPLTITGFSQRSNLGIDRVLLSKNDLRISTNASLTAKDSASYLNGTKIITSERKLAIANFGFSVSSFFKNGTSLYLKPTYIRGTKLLNAKQDQANVSGVTPKAQFEAFKLYANFSKRFVIPKLQTPVTLSTEMDSQFAKQTLFGSEQFSVGGYYSVRGFRENYITGDSGYYFRNKASFGVARQLRIEPFYDYGYIKNKYVSNGADGRLSGTGIKTIFQNNYFSASLTYSWGINKSRLITSNVKENKLLYFEISASCC